MVAFKAGAVGDEDDDDDDEDGEATFWLAAVVEFWRKAEVSGYVQTTKGNRGQYYMVVQWLDVVEGDNYQLIEIRDCISTDRVESLLPVKKSLGTVEIPDSVDCAGPMRRKKKNGIALNRQTKQQLKALCQC